MIYLDSAMPKAGEKADRLKSLLDGLLNCGSTNLLLADCANNLGLSTIDPTTLKSLSLKRASYPFS